MADTHQSPAKEIAVIGIDIGKDVFHLVGFDSRGKTLTSANWLNLSSIT
jgi:hypothetical protein